MVDPVEFFACCHTELFSLDQSVFQVLRFVFRSPVMLAFVLLGQSVVANERSHEDRTQPSNDIATISATAEDRFHQPFQHNLDRLNPKKDGWDSEAYSEAAMSQLKLLGEMLTHDGTTESSIDNVFVANFSGNGFRPEALEVAYADRSVEVRRQESTKGTRKITGLSGVRNAINAFSQHLEEYQSHAHFKIIRVEKQPDSIVTVCYFQVGGISDIGGIQINSTWTCHWQEEADQTLRLISIDSRHFEEAVSKGSLGQRSMFVDRTNAILGNNPSFHEQMNRGLDYWGSTIDRRLGLDIVGIHGVALGDIDGDGLDDVYLCEPGGLPNRMYLRHAAGTLRDVSAVTGTDFLEATRSALLVDLDNDGDQDLVIGSDRFIIFLANDGFGRFQQRAAFRSSAAIVSMAAADYDLDGDLDIYACGYFTKEDAAESAIGLGNPIPFHDANNGARNGCYQNDGNWRFSDVTKSVGLDQDNNRFSLAAAWEDYDLDGDPDLYVANDYGRNCLYRNERGRFINVAAEAGVEDISAGMSISWGDYNRDGWPDIYVSNMFSSAGNRISYHRQFKTDAEQETRKSYQRFAHGNTLFENNGDGTFQDVTDIAKVTLGRWAWGSNFVDINNDGWEDLLVTNGMITRETDTGDL